jgi:hypothetical protein
MIKDQDAADPHANIFHTAELPPEIRAEAELTIADDFWHNESRTLVWQLKDTRITKAAEHLIEQAEYCEEFFDHVDVLMADIKQNGLKQPPVFGPNGIEGNHRIVACYQLGIRTIPSYVARFAPRGFRKPPLETWPGPALGAEVELAAPVGAARRPRM